MSSVDEEMFEPELVGDDSFDYEDFIDTKGSEETPEPNSTKATTEVDTEPSQVSEVEPSESSSEETSTESPQAATPGIKGFSFDVPDGLDDGGNSAQYAPKKRLDSGMIVGAVLASEEDGLRNAAYNGIGNGEILRDEDWAIWRVVYQNRSRNFIPNKDFVLNALRNNKKMLRANYGKYIKIESFKPYAGDRDEGFIQAVSDRYQYLIDKYRGTTEEQFNAALQTYKNEYVKQETNNILKEAITINTDGVGNGRRILQGAEDAFAYVREHLTNIEAVAQEGKGAQFLTLRELADKMMSNGGSSVEKVCSWGIPTLDKTTNGIRTGNLITYLAPPKSGKTKFGTRMCHNALLEGKNVTVWAVEGGSESFLAQLRSIHFDYLYNTSLDLGAEMRGVTQDVILQNDWEILDQAAGQPISDKYRQLEGNSFRDLVTNEEYGSLHFIEGDFELDTFIDLLNTSIDSNNSQLVFIDYMQLLSAGRSGLSKWEVLSEAYPRLLRLASGKNVAILAPAQFSQEAIKGLMKTGSDGSDLRTAGGNSSEIIRSSDLLFALWATTDELKNNDMRILSMPSRRFKPFGTVTMKTDLGVCRFSEVETDLD